MNYFQRSMNELCTKSNKKRTCKSTKTHTHKLTCSKQTDTNLWIRRAAAYVYECVVFYLQREWKRTNETKCTKWAPYPKDSHGITCPIDYYCTFISVNPLKKSIYLVSCIFPVLFIFAFSVFKIGSMDMFLS